MNIKKMFTALSAMVVAVTMTLPSASVFGAEYSQELQDAYKWAHEKGVTTMDSIDNANMYGAITRAEMAKMLSVYAKEVLGKTLNTSAACTFTDIASLKNSDLHDYVIESCQLGIMGQNMPRNEFRPYDTISRAEFGTALSRVLWGSENEGGTPYYAKHLDALKANGIMNQIANAESTKEIRGYVMLMLMRSEANTVDCSDSAVKLACLDPENEELYKECPAACREDADKTDDESDTTVKAGDLAVKVTPATERKAIVNKEKEGVSDLDTITLKASEKITVNSITLERFGYSTASDVSAIWLEDAYGNKIADEKSLSTSKDTVTLKIKKEYRDMNESNALTIVLRTTTGAKAGGTIGFKVTDVDSSAKNLDLSDYNPYTYDLVEYDGATVTVSVKGNDKTYNYEEGEFYEVSRIKVKAGASLLALNGVTLTNEGAASGTTYATLDLDEFVSKVKVTADGKEVSGLKWNVTKDDELVLSWDTIEVAINKDVQIVVSVAMENLDEFGKVVRLVLKDTGDLNATEKKTGARVSVSAPKYNENAWKVYTFNGSKIKFSNTKLSSTIDAAQGSEDVVIAKGKVTVGEEVKIKSLVLKASTGGIIEDMTMYIAGENYDASVSSDKTTFTFSNVIIEESGDFELVVDVVDEEEIVGKTVQITYGSSSSIGKAIFADNNGRYEDSREDVKEADVSGSISISKLKVQESKASLKNNNSNTVEFVRNETSDRKTVFKGTYTAKKSDITLKEFAIVGTDANIAKAKTGDTTLEFYVLIDGEEVGMIDEGDIATAVSSGFDSYEDFSDEVEVAAGKSVSVEIQAVISPDKDAENSNINLDLYLRGEDSNGTAAGFAKAGLNTFKYVMNGSLTISDSTTLAKKTVALQDNEITVAKFTLKPSKSESVKLDNLIFDFSGLLASVSEVEDKVTVTVDGTDIDVDDDNTTGLDHVYFDGTDVDDIEGEVEVEVKVIGLEPVAKADGETYTVADAVSLTLVSVNGVSKNSTYTRLILPAIVTFDNQSSDGGVTKFRVNVDDYEGEQVQNLMFYTKTLTGGEGEAGTVSNGSSVEVSNQSTSEVVNRITFDIVKDGATVSVDLSNSDFADYFKTTNGTTLRVSKVD